MKKFFRNSLCLYALFSCTTAQGVIPEYTIKHDIIQIQGVGPDNPLIYDNDWWTDVPDAVYLWAKASLGEAQLKGNVITRCTFGWETKYAHTLKQQTDEADKLFRLAKESGLKHIPEPVLGSTLAIRKPASGKIEATEFEQTAGSKLIVAAAKQASPEKPLLVFVGGSCTTIASAYLSDPTITDRVIVFQVDGGAYNGSDQWAWKITMQKFRFVNWAKEYFWDKINTWQPDRFRDLPRNPLCDFLREYALKGLGKANHWGDGAWLFELYAPGCLTKVEDYDKLGITIPKSGTNVKRMEEEFFKTMDNKAVYQK